MSLSKMGILYHRKLHLGPWLEHQSLGFPDAWLKEFEKSSVSHVFRGYIAKSANKSDQRNENRSNVRIEQEGVILTGLTP